MKQGTFSKLLNPTLLQDMVNTALKKFNIPGTAPEWVMINRVMTKLKGWTINELAARNIIPKSGQPSTEHLNIVNQNYRMVAELLLDKFPKKSKAIQNNAKVKAKVSALTEGSSKTHQNSTVAESDSAKSQTNFR